MELLRLSENAHLPFGRLTALSEVEWLRYPHPSSLQRTAMCASFLGISSRSKACEMAIFHQPLRSRFFDSLVHISHLSVPGSVLPEIIRFLCDFCFFGNRPKDDFFE